MNKPYGYLLLMGYKETDEIPFKIRQNLMPLLEIVQRELYSASYYVKNKERILKAYFDDNSIKDINLNYFIEQIEVTKEQVEELIKKIDKTIESNENTIKEGMCCSGVRYWTKKDRPMLISNEIFAKSYQWKDLNKIDWDNLPENIYVD